MKPVLSHFLQPGTPAAGPRLILLGLNHFTFFVLRLSEHLFVWKMWSKAWGELIIKENNGLCFSPAAPGCCGRSFQHWMTYLTCCHLNLMWTSGKNEQQTTWTVFCVFLWLCRASLLSWSQFEMSRSIRLQSAFNPAGELPSCTKTKSYLLICLNEWTNYRESRLKTLCPSSGWFWVRTENREWKDVSFNFSIVAENKGRGTDLFERLWPPKRTT